MKKGSAVILTIVLAVAAIGLAFILVGKVENPTGAIPGGGGNIPLKLSGNILNCGRCDGRILFIREDGTSSEGETVKKFRGRARDCEYTAKVRAFSDQDTVYDVTFRRGPFIETLIIPLASIPGGGGNIPLQIDLECAIPVPTETPVPSEEPTEEPTEIPTEEPTEVPTEVPTAEPTAEPTPTSVPTLEPSPTAAPSETPTTPPCIPFANVCNPGVDACCDAGVPCRDVGAGTFRCAT